MILFQVKLSRIELIVWYYLKSLRLPAKIVVVLYQYNRIDEDKYSD